MSFHAVDLSKLAVEERTSNPRLGGGRCLLALSLPFGGADNLLKSGTVGGTNNVIHIRLQKMFANVAPPEHDEVRPELVPMRMHVAPTKVVFVKGFCC